MRKKKNKKPSKGIFKIITLDLEDDLLTVMKGHWIGQKGLVNRPFHVFFFFFFELLAWKSTGSQSSKYEHRPTSALLRNIQNIRICMGKKKKNHRFCNLRNERISIKKKTAYLT